MKHAKEPTTQDHSLDGYINRPTTRELESLLLAHAEDTHLGDQPSYIVIVRDIPEKRRKEK